MFVITCVKPVPSISRRWYNRYGIYEHEGGYIVKICPKCNKDYPDTSSFCTICGGKLETVSEQTKAEAPEPVKTVAPVASATPVKAKSSGDASEESRKQSTGQCFLLLAAIALIISVFVPFYKTNSSIAGYIAGMFDDKISLIDIFKMKSDSVAVVISYAKRGTVYLLIPAAISVLSGLGIFGPNHDKWSIRAGDGIRSIILGVVQLRLLEWHYEKMNVFKGTRLGEFADVSFSTFMDEAAGYQLYFWASVGLVVGGLICLGEAYFIRKKEN